MFIETIRVCDGQLQLLELHQARMSATSKKHYGRDTSLKIRDIDVPKEYSRGVIKLRILYAQEEWSISFSQYERREIRRLRGVVAPEEFDYHLKYADRSGIEELRASRGECDDVLIIKGGCPCDTSYTNIVLTDGESYVVPDKCLLEGVMRRKLISEGRVRVERMEVKDLLPGNSRGFTHLLMINAMLPLETAPKVALEDICLDGLRV